MVGLVKKSSYVRILLLAILPLLVIGCANRSQIRQDITKYLDSTTKASLTSLKEQSYEKAYLLMYDLYIADENKRHTTLQNSSMRFEWVSNRIIWLDELRTLWQQKYTEWDVLPYGRDVYIVKGYELGWKDGNFWPGQWYYYDYPEVEGGKRFKPADSYAGQLYSEITKTSDR